VPRCAVTSSSFPDAVRASLSYPHGDVAGVEGRSLSARRLVAGEAKRAYGLSRSRAFGLPTQGRRRASGRSVVIPVAAWRSADHGLTFPRGLTADMVDGVNAVTARRNGQQRGCVKCSTSRRAEVAISPKRPVAFSLDARGANGHSADGINPLALREGMGFESLPGHQSAEMSSRYSGRQLPARILGMSSSREYHQLA